MDKRTPGHAAYETLIYLDDDLWKPWSEQDDEGRAIWEAVAQAAIRAANEGA